MLQGSLIAIAQRNRSVILLGFRQWNGFSRAHPRKPIPHVQPSHEIASPVSERDAARTP